MKKLLLTTVVLLSTTAVLFAKPDKTKELLKNLRTTMQYTQQMVWYPRGNFDESSFIFQGKVIHVFRDENNLIGFSIPYDPTDLPASIKQAVPKKYPGAKILEANHFIRNSGDEADFILIQPKKVLLVYKIVNGKAQYYGRK